MSAANGMTEAYDWRGRDVIGADGQKIGKAGEVYYGADDRTPEWLKVHTGLFRMKTNFVPTAGARPSGRDIKVAYTRDEVIGAPAVNPDKDLPEAQERELYGHYGLASGVDAATSGPDISREEIGDR